MRSRTTARFRKALADLPAEVQEQAREAYRKFRENSWHPSLKVVWALRLADLWEVRAQHGGNTFRLLGFFDGPRLVVLVSGFMKKTEKVPRQELTLAEERRRDYLRRKGEDE